MVNICLAVSLYILSGFALGNTDLADRHERLVSLPDTNISQWRWPYIHEPKIPIPTEDTALATSRYDIFRSDVGLQDPTPKTRHSKRRRKKKKRKGQKNVHQFSARDPEFHSGSPIIKYDAMAPHEAKVHIVVSRDDASESQTGKFQHPDDPNFYASATLMDFNEDPRIYLQATTEHTDSVRQISPYGNNLPLSHVEEGLPLVHRKPKRYRKKRNRKREKSPDGSPKKKKRQMAKVRIPVRALVYNDLPASRDGRSRYIGRPQSSRHLASPAPIVTLHSPIRIFVPVWEKGDFSGTPGGKEQNCIRCPVNATLIAKRGENSVFQTVPPVAICPSLARRPGTLNLAVTTGPRPGTLLKPGEYAMQLIAWKFRGHVSSCKYTVFVKVRNCPNVNVPNNLLMDCPNGTIWGSVCKFKCASRKHQLRGVTVRSCEENGDGEVDWTAPLSNCLTVTDKPVVKPIIRKPCKEPQSVVDGAVVCGTSKNSNKMYADKTICQYFCYPGFAMSLHNKSHSLVVCEDGVWSPNVTVKCTVDHCLHPKTTQQGLTFNCDESKGRILNGKMTYGTGSNCHFHCKDGFVLLDDRPSIGSVTCLAPHWNSSAVPDCVRALPPLPKACQNSTFVVDPGESLIFGVDIKPPHFASQVKSEILTPICTLSARQLKRGFYANDCKVEDPRTRLAANCSYHIKIRERIPPKPDPKDCSNKIIYASADGMAVLKIPRFYSSDYEDGKHTEKVLSAICAYHGDVGLGTYVNWCTAFDVTLNVTGNCSYTIEVKAYSCPVPKKIPNGKLKCSHQLKPVTTSNYPPDTICEYSCIEGYIIPSKFNKRKVRKCMESLRWNVSVYPYCKKAISPQFHPDDCQHQVHHLEDSNGSINPTIPRVKSNNIHNFKVLCSLNEGLSVGNYSNNCQVIDTESGLFTTCTYDIVVTVRTCLPLEPIEFADVACSVKDADVLRPISSVCSYICHNNYVIPTSQLPFSTKLCMTNAEWNNTDLPSCSEKILPQPNNSSCQDKIIKTSNLSNVTLPLPTFISTLGNPISMKCSPTISLIEHFGILNISCDARDVELRTTNTCDFTVTVLPPDTRPEKSGPPVPVEHRCIDYLLQAEAGENITLVYPEFKTVRNTSADVRCTQLNVTGQNFTQIVSCEAIDQETNMSTSCSFRVTVFYPQSEKSEETTNMPNQDCPHLEAPENGHISCETPHVCKIACYEGYDFSIDFTALKKKSLYCNREDGTWDFQREYGTRIPDCLRELPTTSVEVWLQFKGEVENCDDIATINLQTKITDKLLQMNGEICQTLNCTEAFKFNCTHDEERNRLALTTTWTIRTSFSPQDYEDSYDVPLAETQLETILETTQKAVTTDDDFRRDLLQMGLKLWQNSYNRGHIILVCDERGFMVDPRSDKCMECPTDTAEISRKCEPCPENYYQNRTGQITCLPCLQDFGDGTIPEKCLWGDNLIV